MNMPVEAQQTLTAILQSQRQAFQADPAPQYSQRVAQLQALKQALIAHQDKLTNALKQDYGHRSVDDSMISDIMPCINNINYSLKHLKSGCNLAVAMPACCWHLQK